MTFNDLKKILLLNNSGLIIKENEDAIFALIPELLECKDFNQHSPWHPYSLYEHILYALNSVKSEYIELDATEEEIEKILIMKIAILFHDIGKKDTQVIDSNGIGHFPNHWLVSAEIFNKYAPQMGLSNKAISTINKLILYHEIRFEKMSEREKNAFLCQLTRDEIIMLYKIKRADNMAQSKEAQDLIPMLDEQENDILKKINKK